MNTGRSSRRATPTLVAVGVLTLVVVVAFAALGTWQVQRRAWKHDLIARVDARIQADPVPAPGRADWPALDVGTDAYKRVVATGTFAYDRETLVQAVTELGGGFWVMTPLVGADGSTILVNRGFVPAQMRDAATREIGRRAGEGRVTGLLRLSEPGGGFLRRNDPAADRWYSRDVAAIAASRGLGPTAPYFIDADAEPNPGGYPVGGLTVVAFSDNHLVYALTWYALAIMAAAGGAYVIRDGMRRRDA
ncbi:SURF1 family protein [Methylobacterium sp. WL19]|uniref:SURF1 family protein n=1 Tax=Methylobacterium sp. WL19 TaxID=2603896 RepID=UPI0011C8BE10|nr:SURF1 family protein [Methylobacterium sp. WL19]TXN24963.1 SURF1 family protein [Methylobacterium sp. WL19]